MFYNDRTFIYRYSLNNLLSGLLQPLSVRSTNFPTALTMKPLVMGIWTLKTTIRDWILLVTLMGISTSQRILPTLNGICIFYKYTVHFLICFFCYPLISTLTAKYEEQGIWTATLDKEEGGTTSRVFSIFENLILSTKPGITCSKLTIEALKQGVKYVQS